jgi:hypothetical protein
MVGQTKHCPQCGSTMQFRLGEQECPSCGHVETAPPAPAVVEQEKPQDWGGIKRAKLLNVPPTTAPPPSSVLNRDPSELYGQGGSYGGSLYGAADSPAPAENSSLQMEKHIYFGLQVAGSLLTIIALIAAGSMLSALDGMPDRGALGFASGGVFIASTIIGSLIGVLLMWFVLYGTVIWVKWTCLGCVGLSTIFALIGFFMPTADLSIYDQLGSAMGLGFTTFGILVRIFQLAFLGWFISILYRDIMRLQAGY